MWLFIFLEEVPIPVCLYKCTLNLTNVHTGNQKECGNYKRPNIRARELQFTLTEFLVLHLKKGAETACRGHPVTASLTTPPNPEASLSIAVSKRITDAFLNRQALRDVIPGLRDHSYVNGLRTSGIS